MIHFKEVSIDEYRLMIKHPNERIRIKNENLAYKYTDTVIFMMRNQHDVEYIKATMSPEGAFPVRALRYVVVYVEYVDVDVYEDVTMYKESYVHLFRMRERLHASVFGINRNTNCNTNCDCTSSSESS